MDDDELLRELRRIAQQDPATDPRWRRLSNETLSDDERNALDQLASRSPAAREAREAFTPLDDEARARLTEGILSQLADLAGDAAPPASLTRPIRDRESGIRVRGPREWETDDAGAAVNEPVPMSAEADSLSGTSVAPLQVDSPYAGRPDDSAEPAASASGSAIAAQAEGRADGGGHPLTPRRRAARAAQRGRARELRTRVRTAVTATGWVAAAALVSLLALRPAPFAPGAAPVPAYSLAAGVGEAEPARIAQVAELRLRRGAYLTLTLRPDGHVHLPIAAKAFLARGGELRPWSARVELDDRGAARVFGAREALFHGVEPGAVEIVIAIGEPGSLPQTPERAAEALAEEWSEATAGFRLVRQRLFLE